MLYNIQFLRFVAAMLVVLYHSAAGLPANDSIFLPVFSAGESLGFAGVGHPGRGERRERTNSPCPGPALKTGRKIESLAGNPAAL